jgi:copper chaperone
LTQLTRQCAGFCANPGLHSDRSQPSFQEFPMIHFQVDDMTCGHCASTITRTVQGLDAAAKVTVDLASHRVTVDSTQTSAQALQAAITGAGFTPVPVAGAAAPAARGGCCGGCGGM